MELSKPKVSVLMSVYNETLADLRMAIDSILSQTFKDFEFIIVLDNPQDESLYRCLLEYKEKDERIVVIRNSANIGLALSLNEAIKVARGDYYARMDADDISSNTRIELEYDVIVSGNYDLVCTRYNFIDSNSNVIEYLQSRDRYYTSEEISKFLPYKSIIHHPTVMMSRRIVEIAGPYRNFPCSQDCDLWLRMLYHKARFFMLDKVLLNYRVRDDSTSSKKLLKQKFTIEYIRKLYLERKRKGHDSYSLESYNGYINKYIKNERDDTKRLLNNNKEILIANDLINKGFRIKGVVKKLKVIAGSPLYRHIYIELLRFRFLNKIL